MKEELNRSLEAENAAYRIVGDEVVEITDQNEIEAIETALGGPVDAAGSHLERALELLSDREQPDYRKSIRVHFRCRGRMPGFDRHAEGESR